MRYIGNKTKLLNDIDNLLNKKNLNTEGLTFCDLFAGTGAVSVHYNNFYKIIANDALDCCYHNINGLLNKKYCTFKNLDIDPFKYLNSNEYINYTTGFCYNNFAPNGNRQYFSDENAKKIDFIRNTIDLWYNNKQINNFEKSYLITCLLEAVSKVSNVAGVYSAFLKKWDPRALKTLELLPIEIIESKFDNITYCENADELINKISGDILYLDPPYTPTQYNSQYHVLETIARNDMPEIHGVGAHRTNDRLSEWCKSGRVEFYFEKMIKNAKFKHIIFSYSDQGIMPLSFIEQVLKRYCVDNSYTFIKIDYDKYKSSRAVDREIIEGTENEKHYEYLFYIEKKPEEEVVYSSPLNYIGGKGDIVPFIRTNMPQNNINTFYDLFGGGANVAININAKQCIYNDINPYVTSLLQYFATTPPYEVFRLIKYYTSYFKLEKENKEAYSALRDYYNRKKTPILLYLLICYGFEHQIRFNQKHEFNNPCGNSCFNASLYEKMISFYLRCQDINISFINNNYNNLIEQISLNDFAYLDPPYLLTLGAYQDGKRGFNGWDNIQELELYSNIEKLNNKNILFMLSNCYINNANPQLATWAKSNNFNIKLHDKITKRNRTDRQEIIITNY